MDLNYVLKRPLITEKSTFQGQEGKYAFEVNIQATKIDVKNAVEKIFKVKVRGIQTMILKGKKRKVGRMKKEIIKPNWKKAIVQLAEGNKIDVFESSGSGEKEKK